MKQLYKIFSYTVIFTMVLTSGCKKEEKKSEPKFLDVNIVFSGKIKPTAGKELVVNLYYNELSPGQTKSLVPDETEKVTLTQSDIDNGLRVTFDDFKEVPVAYVSASVDMDGNGTFSAGDLAIIHDDVSYADVESGSSVAKNVAKEYAITIIMNRTIGLDKLKDTDGNEYETVIIGNQEWMAENLKVTHYNNGDIIATGLSDIDWAATTTGAYTSYPFSGISGITSNSELVAKYGLLYNAYAVEDPRGLAPEGWRVPTDDDWKELEVFLGMPQTDADAINWRGAQSPSLKSTEDWNASDKGGTDDYGFMAKPAGYRNTNGTYDRFGTFAYFWTSSESSTKPGSYIRRLLRYNYESVNRSTISANEGSSVRLVKVK